MNQRETLLLQLIEQEDNRLRTLAAAVETMEGDTVWLAWIGNQRFQSRMSRAVLVEKIRKEEAY